MVAAKKAAAPKVFAATVYVHERKPVDESKPDGETYVSRTEVFNAGEEVPEWAVPFVGEHVLADPDGEPVED